MTQSAVSVALSVRDLTVARGGRNVVRNASIDIPPGEITTLLGPNGAGKSTLVLAVAGVLREVAGQVFLGDLELTASELHQKRELLHSTYILRKGA